MKLPKFPKYQILNTKYFSAQKLIITIVVILLLAGAFLKLTHNTKATWYDDNYAYRQKITIGNTGSATGNQKVKLDIDTATLTTDKMQADCDDTRFTDINGRVLKFYLDSAGGACDGVSTDYYVLLPTINTGDTILYMYYGNPQATNGGQSAQFGQDTFTPTSGPTAASEEKGLQPVAYWKFDEGYGTTAQDSTVNNNDGTLGTGSSAPTWTEESRCVSGKCLQFDGTNDVVTVSSTVASIQSVSFWVRPATTSEQLIDLNGSAYIQSSSGTISATGFTSPTIYVNGVVSSTIAANTWQYVTVTTGTALSGSAIKMGQISTNHGQIFLDEPKIYPYARTAAQVKADFAKGSGAKGGGVLGAADTSALSNGLVGYWKMDESSWTVDCSTTSVTDSSGNANNGKSCPTSTGPAGGATGKFGNSGSFDGSNDYVNVGSGTSLDLTDRVSISAWVYPTSNSGWYAIFQRGDGVPNGYRMKISDTNKWAFNPDASGTWTYSSENAVINTWSHVLGTWDGTTTKLYVNGVLVNSIADSGSPTSTTGEVANIGSYGNGTGQFFPGKLDDVRVYNRALSPAEVAQLYNFAPGPVGWWKMDEGSLGTTADSSGNGYNGTDTGATTVKPGKFGQARSMVVAGDYVSVAHNSALNLTIGNAYTFGAWIKINSTEAGNYGIVTKGDCSAVANCWAFQYRGNTTGLNFLLKTSGGTDNIFSAATTLATGNWYYVTVAVDSLGGASSGHHFYVNGVGAGSGTDTDQSPTVPTSTRVLEIGNTYFGNDNQFINGSIDDVKLYNYARSQKQIIEDMNAGHPLGGSPVGSAVGYWKIDEGYGTTVQDTSDNNNDLTMSSASWTNSGKFGKAWNGTNAVWVSRADDADLDFSATEDFAISGWVKSDSATNPSAVEYVVNKASATVAGYAVYFQTDGTLCFGIDDDTTWGPDIASCTSADFYDNAWHHFVAVRDYSGTDKTYIYVDAIQRDSDSDSTSATLANSQTFYVGDRDGTDNGSEFAGDVDEVKVYRAALALSEIKVDYNRGQSLVLGALSDNSSYDKQAANQEYCVPGDSTSCAAPVGEWKMDERSGTSANDTSGNGNTGTLGSGSSAPTWTAGKIGAAVNFDGSNDYVSVASPSIGNWGSSGSVSIWFKPAQTYTSASGPKYMLSKFYGPYIIYDYIDGKLSYVIYNSANTEYSASKTMSLTANTWYHVEGVHTATNIYLYINGELVDTQSVSMSSPKSQASALAFGSQYDGSNYFFNGIIDHVRVFNYARTAAQIAWDYNRGGPVGWWKMDECTGSTAYDASGNGNTGTITIASSGTQTSAGTCSSGTSTEAWNNGGSGKFNASLDFDGTDDYVTTNNVADNFNSSSDLTITAWVKANNNHTLANDKKGTIAGFHSSIGANKGPILLIGDQTDANNNNELMVYDGTSGAYEITTNTVVADNTWHFVTYTKSATTGTAYVDGISKGTHTTDYSFASTDLWSIAQEWDNATASDFIDGQIDDVRIFNYALTAVQVKNVYNNASAVYWGPNAGQP